MRNGSTTKTKVAIAGLGAIGTEVAKALDAGIDGLELVAVSAANIDKHRGWLDKLAESTKLRVAGGSNANKRSES